MSFVKILAGAAVVAVLVTYLRAAWYRKPVRWFHWANVLGAPPVMVTEIAVGAWQALVLTTAFGFFGALGLLSEYRDQGCVEPDPG